MADVFISYSHADYDAADAVRGVLVSHGVDVWFDEPDQNAMAADLALPAGQTHWSVIADEILRAGLVLELATENWRASQYCRDEHEHAVALGKWIVTAAAPDLDELERLIGERREYVAAHARLLVLAGAHEEDGGGPEQGARRGVRARLTPPDGAREARTVLGAADPGAYGVTLTPELAEFAAVRLDAAAAARARVRRLVTGAVTGLAGIAAVSVIGLVIALFAEGAAVAASASASARQLLSASTVASNTVEGIGMAQRSFELVESDEADAAKRAAVIRDRRQRSIPLPAGEYLAAAWSPEGDVVVAATRAVAVRVDTVSGEVTALVALPGGPREQNLVVSAGGLAAFIATSDGVISVDFEAGTAESVRDATRVRLASDGTGIVWFGDANGIGSARIEGAAWTESRVRTPVVAGVDAIAVRGDRLDVVTSSAELIAFDVSSGHPVERARTALPGVESADRAPLDVALIRCGDAVHGVVDVGGAFIRSRFTWDAVSAASPEVRSGGLRGTVLLCDAEEVLETNPAWHLDAVADGGFAPLARDWSTHDLAVADPRHRRVAVVDDAGVLQVFSTATPTARSLTSASGRRPQAAVMLGNRVVALVDGDRFVDVWSEETVAMLPRPLEIMSGEIELLLQGQLVSTTCGVFSATAEGLVFTAPDGESRIVVELPSSRALYTLQASGDRVSVLWHGGTFAVSDACGQEVDTIALPTAASTYEVTLAAALSGDRATLARLSASGELSLSAADELDSSTVSVDTGQATTLAFLDVLPDGDLVSLVRGGPLTRWSPQLERVVAVDVGSNEPAGLRVIGDRLLVVTDTAEGAQTRIYDADGFALLEVLDGIWITSEPAATADGERFVGITRGAVAQGRIALVPRLDADAAG